MARIAWQGPYADALAALGVSPVALRVDGEPGGLPSRLPVGDTAVACVATALTAAARLRPGAPNAIGLDAGQVAVAVRSEAHLRVDGRSFGTGFDPLSRFWRAADGWVRTHANYAWHREALARALDVAADAEAIGAAIAGRSAEQVEAQVVDAGGVAAAVRTPEQWRAHPQGSVDQPLIASDVIDGAAPRHPQAGDLPASGMRVLDLTRVIAGPVATRYLAALGADVLRIDPPHRPELPQAQYDGLPGKRSAVLDARTPGGLRRLHELLDGADVVVHGYRPGALAVFGLDPAALAERHPGLVVVSLSAWGRGPWGGRRGFDSIVQAACGIAMVESPDGEQPGRLSCQLLDHGTGYLAAAATLEGLRRQREIGGTHRFELCLAATAGWLLALPPPDAPSRPEAAARVTTLQSDDGPVTVVAPPGSLDGRALTWPPRLTTYGADAPSWA
jgi:hypothetical protein